jgi:hypothetical protein
VATVLAVADAAGAERFRVFATSQSGQVAAAIAARYPERVEALVVYGMCASGRDLLPAGVFVTDPTAEDLAAFTRFERASASAAVAARMLEIYYETDIRALLPAIRVRTAVLHREADRGTGFELGREAAALIPGPIPDSAAGFEPPTYHGDWLAILDAMLGFLCGPASPGPRPRLTGPELEVADLVAEGLTNQAIARRSSVALRTGRRTWRTFGASWKRTRHLRSRCGSPSAGCAAERLGSSPDARRGAVLCAGRLLRFAGSSPDGRLLPHRPSVKACQKLRSRSACPRRTLRAGPGRRSGSVCSRPWACSSRTRRVRGPS